MTIKAGFTLLICAAALAACQSAPMQRSMPAVTYAAPTTTVEGTWADPNGILSTFQAGTFNTRTTDSNQLLATGTYVVQPTGVVEINLFSNLKKTTSRVNCNLSGPSQLNCTSDSGAQFSLARRA